MSIFPQKLSNSATSLLTIKCFDLLGGTILIFSIPSTKKLLTSDTLYRKLSCTNRKEGPGYAVISFEASIIFSVKWLYLLEWRHAKYMRCLTWFYCTCTNISTLLIMHILSTCCKLSVPATHHILAHDVRPIDRAQLTVNFDRCYALCIQKLYHRRHFTVGGSRKKPPTYTATTTLLWELGKSR